MQQYDPNASREVRTISIGRAAQDELAGVATLAVIEERCALLLTQQLETALQTRVQVTAEPARLQKWSETLASLEDPGCHALLQMEAIGGHGVASMEREVFFGMLEKLFGASQVVPNTATRARLSSIEERVARRLLRGLARSLEQAWKPILALHVNVLRVEARAQSVAITSPDDAVIMTSFKVEIGEPNEQGEGVSQGRVFLTLPKVNVWRFRELLSAGRYELSPDRKESWRKQLEQTMHEVEVEVCAELGRAQLKLSELMSLEVGQVLRLDRSPDMPTLVQVNGHPKYLARTSIQHGNLAIELESAILSPRDAQKLPH